MRTLVVSLLLLATATVTLPSAAAADCPDYRPCCKLGEVAIYGQCYGACDFVRCDLPTTVFLPPVTTKCFDQLDRPINDGGITVCVDWGREGCAVWTTQEYIWGTEYRCHLSWPDLVA